MDAAVLRLKFRQSGMSQVHSPAQLCYYQYIVTRGSQSYAHLASLCKPDDASVSLRLQRTTLPSRH